MTFGQGDVADMLADLGEDVTIGGVTAKGLYRRAGDAVLEGGAVGTISNLTTIVVERGAFPALNLGVAVQVDGKDWVARKPLDMKDPRFQLVELQLA